MENSFGEALKQLCEPYDNIHFIDFYSSPPQNLRNDHFYDIQHLNREGAKLFSEDIVGILTEAVLIHKLPKP
jgi:hypothetical protein